MSVSYYTDNVVGVRLSDFGVKTTTVNTKATRYDTTTGAPYEIDVQTSTTTYGNLTLPGDLEESLRYFTEDGRYELEDEADEDENSVYLGAFLEANLRFFVENCHGPVSLLDGILGCELASVSDWGDSVVEIEMENVLSTMEKLKEALKTIFGVDCQVKLYSVMHVSC
jgi:hypothetical protein